MNRSETVEKIVESITGSGKYSNVYPGTIHRVAETMSTRFGKEKEVEKNVRKKLHQIYGAYFGEGVRGLADKGWDPERVNFILRSHVSTAERTGFYSEFYERIFSEAGEKGEKLKVYDAACGYNPFSADLFKEWILEYKCSDIDVELNTALNNFFAEKGLLNFSSENRDLLSEPADLSGYDAVFLFKTLSCIERQEKGSARKILDQALRARRAIVSFPLKSIGGREKGMGDNYTRFMEDLITGRELNITQLVFPNELVFVLRNGS